MSVTAETNGGVVTSWIPLTTVFTPPSGCESSFRFVGSLLAFASNYGGIANKCVAPAVTSWWEQVDRDGSTITSIQPLTCPYLWTTATTVVTDSTSTQIMCCPSGYSPQSLRIESAIYGVCNSIASKDKVLTFVSWSFTTDLTFTTTLSEPSNIEALPLIGYNVARTTSTATASSELSSRLSTSSPSAPSNRPIENGLSTGAKTGIGLGVSLGVLVIGALILMVFLRRRRRRNRPSKPEAAAPAATSGFEDKTSGMTQPDFTQEIDGRPVYSELPSGEVHSPVEPDTHGRPK